MKSDPNQITTNQKALMPLWLSLPLYLIASFLVVAILAFFFTTYGPKEASESIYLTGVYRIILWSIQAFAVTLTAYLFLKYINRVSPRELGLSLKGRGIDCLAGILLAVVLYAVGFGISLLLGVVSITQVQADIPLLLLNLVMFFVAAWYEEVMCRGYIQGRLMTRMNKFLALAVTSLVFSVFHFGNPNLGVLPIINLFLAGVMLGASYLYTRNLWFPITLHLFWNWIQGPVLGYGVSGLKISAPVLTLVFPENNILNGGAFGFEGSIICTILLIIASAGIICWGERKHN